jgi:hypothetical protein
MKTRIITAAAIGAVLALPLSAGAMEPAPTPGAPKGAPSPGSATSSKAGAPGSASAAFKELDANKDGHISRDEAKRLKAVSDRFTELDLNRDGKLSQIELDAGSSPAAGAPRTGTTGSSPPKK